MNFWPANNRRCALAQVFRNALIGFLLRCSDLQHIGSSKEHLAAIQSDRNTASVPESILLLCAAKT